MLRIANRGIALLVRGVGGLDCSQLLAFIVHTDDRLASRNR
jgi:hypothetical protein